MKKIYLSLAILAGIGLAGCNDSFLEHAPVTSLMKIMLLDLMITLSRLHGLVMRYSRIII